MSILTKIGVVVLLVLVLLACPVFINMATVPQNYKHLYRQAQEDNQLLSVNLSHNQLALSQAVAARQRARSELRDVERTTAEKVQQLQSQLANVRQEKEDLSTDLTGIRAQLADLSTTYGNYVKQQEILRRQLADIRERNTALTETNIEINDLLRQRTAEFERVEQQVIQLREQIQERRETIAELRERLAAAGPIRDGETDQAPSPVGGADISGTITAVQGDIVAINIGSAKGVRAGMKLIIYRGANFVGELRVDDVEVGSAAGVVINQRLDPRQGDKVTTEAGLSRS